MWMMVPFVVRSMSEVSVELKIEMNNLGAA